MFVRCIQGFKLDGGSLGILKGEVFEQMEFGDDIDGCDFEATDLSRFPGQIIFFPEDVLVKFFEIIPDPVG